tara:strand:+ start:213 stop:647 length:435 start_codon:yes stop_codon:yes gene_type:complete
MLKANKKSAPKPSTKTKSVELLVSDKEITYQEIHAFVNKYAGGNMGNVQIVALDNVDLKNPEPVPFGYGGKGEGVRATIQNWALHGVPLGAGKVDRSLRAVLTKAKKLGHSSSKPNCIHALMHGGYTPSSKTWMKPFVKLVVTA